jgi:hypothetical protein
MHITREGSSLGGGWNKPSNWRRPRQALIECCIRKNSKGEFAFGLTSRAVRVCGAVALAVGAALAIPSVAMAGGPLPHGGTGCGYLHADGDNNAMFWKNCSNHEEWVQLRGAGEAQICVQAGEDPFVGYKVRPTGDTDIYDA